MRRTMTVSALLLGVLCLALAVQVHGEKVTAPRQQLIPLKVTFYAYDDNSVETRMYGHSSEGRINVQYIDASGHSPVGAYLMRDTGELWFHIDSTADRHINLEFNDPNSGGAAGSPPLFEGPSQQTSFRMTTIGTEGALNFLKMPAGVVGQGLVTSFWCCGDQYAWQVRYDGVNGSAGSSTVDIEVEQDGDGNNIRWTMRPRSEPDNIDVYGGAQLDKYTRHKPQPGVYLDYGTWVMPFKVVIELK